MWNLHIVMMKASAVVRIVLRPLAIGVEADVIVTVVSEKEKDHMN